MFPFRLEGGSVQPPIGLLNGRRFPEQLCFGAEGRSAPDSKNGWLIEVDRPSIKRSRARQTHLNLIALPRPNGTVQLLPTFLPHIGKRHIAPPTNEGQIRSPIYCGVGHQPGAWLGIRTAALPAGRPAGRGFGRTQWSFKRRIHNVLSRQRTDTETQEGKEKYPFFHQTHAD